MLNGEFKARPLAGRLLFNLFIEGTGGVVEFHCKVGEEGGLLKILRN